MPRRTVPVWSLAVILSAGALLAQAPPAQVTVLRAAHLIDGTGAPPLRPAMIRVEGERIVAGGANVRVTPGARVVDLDRDDLGRRP